MKKKIHIKQTDEKKKKKFNFKMWDNLSTNRLGDGSTLVSTR